MWYFNLKILYVYIFLFLIIKCCKIVKFLRRTDTLQSFSPDPYNTKPTSLSLSLWIRWHECVQCSRVPSWGDSLHCFFRHISDGECLQQHMQAWHTHTHSAPVCVCVCVYGAHIKCPYIQISLCTVDRSVLLSFVSLSCFPLHISSAALTLAGLFWGSWGHAHERQWVISAVVLWAQWRDW